jgi:hypothetical protein
MNIGGLGLTISGGILRPSFDNLEFLVPETFKNRQEATAWQQKYDPGAPKVGDLAPDFQLFDVRGEESVRLSDFRDKKPVALVFGSFT